MNMRIHTKLRIALAGTHFHAALCSPPRTQCLKLRTEASLVMQARTTSKWSLAWKEARFYLLDTLGNTLPVEGLTGTAYIRFNNRTTDNPEMVPDKKGYLRAALKSPYGFTVVASIKLPSGFVSVQLTSGPREIPQPVEQHNASDGHRH
jgi:hypothetical protein